MHPWSPSALGRRGYLGLLGMTHAVDPGADEFGDAAPLLLSGLLQPSVFLVRKVECSAHRYLHVDDRAVASALLSQRSFYATSCLICPESAPISEGGIRALLDKKWRQVHQAGALRGLFTANEVRQAQAA